MTSIVLSSNYLSQSDFKLSELGKDPFLFGLGGKPADHIKPYTPYCIGKPSTQDAAIVASLSNGKTGQCIAQSCRILGVDNLLGLSEMYGGLHSGGLSAASAAFGTGSDSYKLFANNLARLEAYYLEMHKAKAAGNTTHYNLVRSRAQALHTEVNRVFAREVDKVTSTIKSRKGAPLKDFARAENIVKGSRNLSKLNFLDLTQATNLGDFAKGARIAGSALLIFDVGVGVSKTYTEYEKGGNWHRTMFVESTKIATVGAITLAASTVAAGVFLTLTPVGWVVLAGALAVGTYAAVQTVERDGGAWYDTIMEMF